MTQPNDNQPDLDIFRLLAETDKTATPKNWQQPPQAYQPTPQPRQQVYVPQQVNYAPVPLQPSRKRLSANQWLSIGFLGILVIAGLGLGWYFLLREKSPSEKYFYREYSTPALLGQAARNKSVYTKDKVAVKVIDLTDSKTENVEGELWAYFSLHDSAVCSYPDNCNIVFEFPNKDMVPKNGTHIYYGTVSYLGIYNMVDVQVEEIK